MGKLKLNNKKSLGVIMLLCVLCIIVCIVVLNLDKFTYDNDLEQILGVKQVAIENKEIVDSWAVGEWYVCESYELDKMSLGSFLSMPAPRNNIYLSEDEWIRVNWEKLPINNAYSAVESMIVNYAANASLNKIINEMKNVLSSNNGYYSFLVQPSLDIPEKILFCLLDIKGHRLYIVDLKI